MSPEDTEAFVRREFNRLRGKLAGFIESHELSERTERSLVSTMKSLSYDAEQHIVDQIHE